MIVDEVLERLQGVTGHAGQWTARCPAHDDHQASLTVGTGQDGRVLVHCFAGCTLDEITAALNLTPAALFAAKAYMPSSNGPRAPWGDMPLGKVETDLLPDPDDLGRHTLELQHDGAMLERIYELKGWRPEILGVLNIGLRGDRLTIPITNLAGELVNLLRYWPEKHPKMLALKGHARTPLYCLHDDEGPVYIAEGETDAIALAHLGLNAIGAPGASARARVEWLTPLEGRDVIIVFDADTPGQRAAQRWAAAAQEAGAATVRVITLQGPTGYDVGDLVREQRHTPDHGRGALWSSPPRQRRTRPSRAPPTRLRGNCSPAANCWICST